MVSAKRFWDRAAPKYARQPVKDVASWDETLARTRRHLAATDEVLEVGCGTGSSALRLADAVGRLTATDISGEMIAIARQKAAKAGVDNVTFRAGTLDDPALPAGGYDAVLALNLLHLVEDVPRALGRIREVLRPGGVFISKSACLKGRGWYLRPLIGAMRAVGRAPRVAFFSATELDRMVSAAGFAIVEAEDIPPGAPTRFIVARKA